MDKLTWYGHATFGLELGEYKLLVDPFFNQNPLSPVKAEKIEADFILITHGHFDHIGDAESIAKRCNSTLIANAEIAGWLHGKKLNTHAQQIGGGFSHPFGYVKLTPALHGSKLPDGSYGGLAAGFIITTNAGKKIYLAGDTGLFSEMELIGEEGIDLAVIPIGDNYTMGPDDALRAVKMLQPTTVIPMHYNTWELIHQNVDAWKTRVEAETSATVQILKPGESFEF
ncbi:MAG: metal-dependent hydrolase [Anaerolineae bacterium]|nr:metal-dependent hydrolase [Anaerolineae bacterium]